MATKCTYCEEEIDRDQDQVTVLGWHYYDIAFCCADHKDKWEEEKTIASYRTECRIEEAQLFLMPINPNDEMRNPESEVSFVVKAKMRIAYIKGPFSSRTVWFKLDVDNERLLPIEEWKTIKKGIENEEDVIRILCKQAQGKL